MDNVIRLNKITKTIGIITAALFGIIVLVMLVNKNIGAAVCFTPFVFLGIVLILAYKKQIIVVNEDELVFSYLIKKTQCVRYKDIRCILVIPLNNRTQVALVDREYNRIITLDLLLANDAYLYAALEKNNIEIINFGELVEQHKDVSRFVKTLNWMERNYYKTVCNEDETVKSLSKSKEKDEIKKTKLILRVLGWILIFSDAAAVFIGGKAMIFMLIAILLTTYIVYIKYYPYIYIEVTTKKGQEQAYQMPFMGSAIALLLSLNLSKLFNYDFSSFMKITAAITVLLAIPFLIKSSRTDVKQRFARKLSVIFAAFIIAFTITFPVNFLLTFDGTTHEEAIVTDKKISGGKTRDYELYVEYNGENDIFTVQRSEYESTSIGDAKRVCMRKSALGLEYCTIHD